MVALMSKSRVKEASQADALRFHDKEKAAEVEKDLLHVFGKNSIVCETDIRGLPTPEGRSPTDLVVNSSEGFIPLWAQNVTLRWRFQERSMSVFQNPESAKNFLRDLFGKGLLLWGEDWAPVKFTEAQEAWDFEIVVRSQDNCTINGCTLASAFFPDAGRHELVIYPKMFEQSRKEQEETLAHEIGHIFGLRHFFANITEKRWSSEIFGKHSPFSIMNYGPKSSMTENDRSDLKKLYELAWSGRLTEINGTEIRLMRPFSSNRSNLAKIDLAA